MVLSWSTSYFGAETNRKMTSQDFDAELAELEMEQLQNDVIDDDQVESEQASPHAAIPPPALQEEEQEEEDPAEEDQAASEEAEGEPEDENTDNNSAPTKQNSFSAPKNTKPVSKKSSAPTSLQKPLIPRKKPLLVVRASSKTQNASTDDTNNDSSAPKPTTTTKQQKKAPVKKPSLLAKSTLPHPSSGGIIMKTNKKKKGENGSGNTAAASTRVKSSYQLFCDEHRPRIKADNPKAGMGEISKLLSIEWGELTDEEKAPFIEKSKELKANANANANNTVVIHGNDAKKGTKNENKRAASCDLETEEEESKKKKKERKTTENDSKDDDDIDRENVDWNAHPALAILSKTRTGKYIIARQGLPLHLYGEVSVNLVHQQRTQSTTSTDKNECPVSCELLEEYEEFNKAFKRDIFNRTDDGELDLDPEELGNSSTLESCAFLGSMRDPGYELNNIDHKKDVAMKVPMMAMSRIVQRMIHVKCMEVERENGQLKERVAELEEMVVVMKKKKMMMNKGGDDIDSEGVMMAED